MCTQEGRNTDVNLARHKIPVHNKLTVLPAISTARGTEALGWGGGKGEKGGRMRRGEGREGEGGRVRRKKGSTSMVTRRNIFE